MDILLDVLYKTHNIICLLYKLEVFISITEGFIISKNNKIEYKMSVFEMFEFAHIRVHFYQ